MPTRRVNPCLVKRHRTYTAGELAARLGVHKNTVRHWQRSGLTAIDRIRPALFHGQTVRTFLGERNVSRKRPCPAGTFYCFRCRQPRPPVLGMVDYIQTRPGTGNLRGLCETCGTVMHRRARSSGLSAAMPGIDVQITQAPSRLVGSAHPSSNCDSERHGAR